jgi:hypothetical protein
MSTDSTIAMMLPLVIASPWIVGSIIFWLTRPKDGYLPPSWADLTYRR